VSAAWSFKLGASVGSRSLLLLLLLLGPPRVFAVVGALQIRGLPALVGSKAPLLGPGLSEVRAGLGSSVLLAGVWRLLPAIVRLGPGSTTVPAQPSVAGPHFVVARAFPPSADDQQPIFPHYLGIP